MLHTLAKYEYIFGPFRLLNYLTFRIFASFLLSLAIGFMIAPACLRLLKKLRYIQVIRGISEVNKLAFLHEKKKTTPTMGGLIIYIPVVISTIFLAKLNVYVLSALVTYSCFTIVGFADDYLKISKKNSSGLSSSAKWFAQAGITFLAISFLLLDTSTHLIFSQLWVPFLKVPFMQIMPLWFIFLFSFIVISATSNSINLTDGIDGLAIGCILTVSCVFGLFSYLGGNKIITDYLLLPYVPKSEELSIVCASLVGSSLVFLWYNSHPAEIFMGDTGSLAIGGLIGMIALIIHQPFTLFIAGGVFVLEAMSVILQVFSFKFRNGRRIFKMSPAHHHFELSGIPEQKVVIRFWILSIFFAILSLSLLKIR